MAGPVSVAVLGGTGDLGGGFARFLLRQGARVIIGSRDAERARAAARELSSEFPNAPTVLGESLAEAAAAAELVVVTVPYAAHRATLDAVRDVVQGKLLLDATVPLRPPKVLRVQLPAAGSAAVEGQQLLGEGVRIVAALHNIAASHLAAGTLPDCDVLVTGDKEADRQVIVDLLEAGGLRAWHAGPLANSAAAEALTSILIGINKRYGIHGAGIRITGTPQSG
ncbi:MAG: NADPH-dependent F420 reductase [Proteobacteria bacterium]|nr:NADPH-dependent F420 reductase [Pseudomonadota bacterium]